MSDAPLIVGVSGMRGIAGRSLTPETAARFAGAFGRWLLDRPGARGRVLVTRDGRALGETLEHAAVAGLLGAGCAASPCGVATTPSTACAVDDADADAAVIITASHNPQEWNGLKLLYRDRALPAPSAAAPAKPLADEIIARWQAGDVTSPEGCWASPLPPHDPVAAHLRRLEAAARTLHPGIGEPIRQAGFTAVLDSVNASGGAVAAAFLRGAARAVHAINLHDDRSGWFPHTPEPTAENLAGDRGLCGAVPALRADIGFAQDPDADRLAIIDETGRYIGEEYTLALCALGLLSALAEHGATPARPVIVANLSTSRMIEDVAARHGAEVVRTPVGEANVVERMRSLAAEGASTLLGGEGNGGVIWPDVCSVRDSIGSMALVLNLMARTGKPVSRLAADIDALSPGGAGYAIVKRKTAIRTRADADPACAAVRAAFPGARVDTQDGVRVDLDDAGAWLHVRASNTEPIVRLICEAPTAAAATDLLGKAEAAIARQGTPA